MLWEYFQDCFLIFRSIIRVHCLLFAPEILIAEMNSQLFLISFYFFFKTPEWNSKKSNRSQIKPEKLPINYSFETKWTISLEITLWSSKVWYKWNDVRKRKEFYALFSYENILQSASTDLDFKSDSQTKAQNLRSFNEFSAFYGIN